MNWQLIIGSGGLVGIGAIIFYLGRIVARFEARFDSGERNQASAETRMGDRFTSSETRMEDRFKGMDKRIVSEFETISKRLDKLDDRIHEVITDLREIRSRLDRLEVRVEERTLKVITIQRESQEKVLEQV